MGKCIRCGHEAYVGATVVECSNHKCESYDEKFAKTVTFRFDEWKKNNDIIGDESPEIKDKQNFGKLNDKQEYVLYTCDAFTVYCLPNDFWSYYIQSS